jgi:V/A-type H+/Na+-transporting ATPase subunit D
MARLDVKPTRMELLNLKKRLKGAIRGHKLLKDKQDGLMSSFMKTIREAKSLRKEVEEVLANSFKNFMQASAMMHPEILESALLFPSLKTELAVETRNVMSVNIPFFDLKQEGDILNFGYLQTSAELDIALKAFSEALPKLIHLAQIEKQAEALAKELETTRRRVNALEHKMIPDQKETIKFITMKLEEAERATKIATMIVKKQIEEKALLEA